MLFMLEMVVAFLVVCAAIWQTSRMLVRPTLPPSELSATDPPALLPTHSVDLDGLIRRDVLFEIDAERIRNTTPGG